ncbi:MAG: hypothetical protein ABW034_21815 [Steroidobacteraceae bacterium]
MNRLAAHRRLEILLWLCRGASLRGVTRSSGVSVNTVTKLLIDAGRLFTTVFDERMSGIKAKRLVCYKGWCPIVTPGMSVHAADRSDNGVWVWVAVDCDTSLIVSYQIGGRDPATARAFMSRLSRRLARPLPPLTDAEAALVSTDDTPFGINTAAKKSATASAIRPLAGADLQMLQKLRRRGFTRKGTAYSRKPENLGYMAVIYYVWSNFVRKRKDGRTPAMMAGLADRPYELAEVAAPLIDGEKTLDRAERSPDCTASHWHDRSDTAWTHTWRSNGSHERRSALKSAVSAYLQHEK